MKTLNKPKALYPGDKVAIVSLSGGQLGDPDLAHNVRIGQQRLSDMGLTPIFMPNSLRGSSYLATHPKARAADLKAAFLDDSIKGIICAIGGIDTYRLVPYLLNDSEFRLAVTEHPKLFTGFSDTTINHLLLYQLGLATFYGPAFITDLAEISTRMLPYSEQWFRSYLAATPQHEITASLIWYEERTDFSVKAIGQERKHHQEQHGFIILQGQDNFEGRLLGGCLESLADLLLPDRYPKENLIANKFGLFPNLDEWREKILFIETSEDKPTPDQYRKELLALKAQGIFDVITGVLVGKPQDEVYQEDYHQILKDVIANSELPIVANLNFGHATPRCVLPIGLPVYVDLQQQKIVFKENMFAH